MQKVYIKYYFVKLNKIIKKFIIIIIIIIFKNYKNLLLKF